MCYLFLLILVLNGFPSLLFPGCLGDHLSVSSPDGPFSLRLLREVTHLYLLAAGTGFTPMARVIRLALQDLRSLR